LDTPSMSLASRKISRHTEAFLMTKPRELAGVRERLLSVDAAAGADCPLHPRL
jgi:hypothetical protein